MPVAEASPALIWTAFIGAFVLFFGGIWWWASRTVERERARIQQAAAAIGLRYSEQDADDTTSLPLPLFGRGDSRSASHVFDGTWQGLEVKVFQFQFTEEHKVMEAAGLAADVLSVVGGGSADSEDADNTYLYTCALTTVPTDASDLTVGPENVLTRLAGAAGMDDIQLESEDFNRRYRVLAADRKYAFKVLDARMMQWLLSLDGRLSFQLSGEHLLAFVTPQLKLETAEQQRLLEALTGFAEHLPRMVTKRR